MSVLRGFQSDPPPPPPRWMLGGMWTGGRGSNVSLERLPERPPPPPPRWMLGGMWTGGRGSNVSLERLPERPPPPPPVGCLEACRREGGGNVSPVFSVHMRGKHKTQKITEFNMKLNILNDVVV